MKVAWLNLLAVMVPVLTGCSGGDQHPGGSGLVESDEVLVAAETSGRVETLFFDEGSTVVNGDTLAVIDPSRLQLELSSALAGQKVAQANLHTVEVQLERARKTEAYAGSERDRIAALLASGTATQKQYDQVEYEYSQAMVATKAARANIETVEAELNRIATDIKRIERAQADCYPLAPASGTITEKYVDRGELLGPGRPIARIARLDTLWVKVYLPTTDFARVKIGDRATVDTETSLGQLAGEVVWTAQEAEFTPKNVQTRQSRADLVYAVKVRIPNTDGALKIGMPVYVTLESR
ncbi:MAG: efflux RND transporter periplasmic adaptor subunit [candidate division Zixibacteria bacterium]|nr:efflux RND transporter periplasmic adaptor subunit [candidate division Zixibacteria bacterium]